MVMIVIGILRVVIPSPEGGPSARVEGSLGFA